MKNVVLKKIISYILISTYIVSVSSLLFCDDGHIPTGRSGFYYIKEPYNLKYTHGGAFLFPDDLSMEEFEKILAMYPEGSYGLEDFMNFYIYQLDVEGLSNRTGLCNFSSYMMAIQYLTGTVYSTQQLAALAKQYTAADGTCDNIALMAHFGIKGDSRAQEKAMNPSAIQTALQNGQAVIGHIQNGTLGGKHYDGHYFMITGVDSTGYTIVDPGAKYSYKSERHVSAEEVAKWATGGYRVIG